ncbi:MAG: hypothetical protein VX498_05965 [Myxococcota bacterium]|nr:hypothetical protein [Myxococcota bacterium]
MGSRSTLIVYRGRPVALSDVHAIAARLLGGHLRPDAELVVHASAPVRVDPRVESSPDPSLGTVRVLHLAVSSQCENILTELSRMLLKGRLGFPDEFSQEAWEHFGEVPAEAIGLALSEVTGPVAVLSHDDGAGARGSYSIFVSGRRIWSASYRPDQAYTTWDGSRLLVEPMGHESSDPMEGSCSDFPAHGLKLLFTDPLPLTTKEIENLIPVLWRASRPPTEAADGMWLVEQGRFVDPGRGLTGPDWSRFVGSF